MLLQRVSQARVRVGEEDVGAIGPGLLVLVGFGANDSDAGLQSLLEKLVNLRVFSDERGRFMHSLLDIRGELLLVPQFTLYADTSRGRRPDFGEALEPARARLLFDTLVERARNFGLSRVAAGRFGAHMHVELTNDGPVTILLEDPR